MTYEEKQKLLRELEALKQEKKDLEEAIESLMNEKLDEINLKRFHKRKQLVDQQISILEDTLFPDISA